MSGEPDAESLGTNQRVRFTESTPRQASIRDKRGPSLGKIQVKPRHQRSPYAVKIEDRSDEETERRQRCARGKDWHLAKNTYKLKANDKATFLSLAEKCVLRRASARELQEREFVVDFGASMHMVSEKDHNSAELETVRASESPTTVVTANGEVLTKEEATVYVKQCDVFVNLFVTVMLLQETFAVLSLAKLCEEHGCTYHSKSGQKPHLIKNGKRVDCKKTNYVPLVVPEISASSSSTTPSSASSSSSSQESTSANRDSVSDNRSVETPVSERSGGTNEELRGEPLHESAETENQNKAEEVHEIGEERRQNSTATKDRGRETAPPQRRTVNLSLYLLYYLPFNPLTLLSYSLTFQTLSTPFSTHFQPFFNPLSTLFFFYLFYTFF